MEVSAMDKRAVGAAVIVVVVVSFCAWSVVYMAQTVASMAVR
jgi:hypothetical protein